MLDYSFFALLFALATTLAPADAREVGFQNVRHPDQSMSWQRGDDGRWAMTMNGREVGHFRRDGEAVVHETGVQDPQRFEIAALMRAADLRRDAARIHLGSRFGDAVVEVDRSGNAPELHEPAQRVLVTRLRLRSGP